MGIYNRIREYLSLGSKVTSLKEEMQHLNSELRRMQTGVEDLKMLTAKIYANLLNSEDMTQLTDAEFKVFSEYGDDGIIQYLIKKLDIKVKTFVEFGVENYTEANTRYLLLNDLWKGLIIDGSESNILQIKRENIYWRRNLTAVAKFITSENINDVIEQNGFNGEIGILHIDIDGNDYWVWKALNVINPQIVIVEYNAVFGLNPWTIPYDAQFYRTQKHYSNLYFGTSLTALQMLAEQKGYSFVGCNSNGNNAYFIRNDKLGPLVKLNANDAFVNSQFRESRDAQGNLTHLSGEERIKLLIGLPVYNILTDKIDTI